jgi:hypothetical protein
MDQNTVNQKIRIGFVAFDLGIADLHITIGRRYDATEQELIEMQRYVDQQIKPQMPFTITFGNFCYMGENGTFPAYRVYFVDPMQLISSFYTRFYKDGPNKALYPRPKFHITVDTPEKRAALEQVIRQHRYMKLTNVAFKTRIEGGITEVTQTTWKCQICGNVNPLDQKQCLTANCDQWRPLGVAPNANSNEEKQRYDDWICCGVNNFASRSQCMRCGKPKQPLNPYEQPPIPTAPSYATMPDLRAQPPAFHPATGTPPWPASGPKQDWWCPRCNFKIFGSKDKCFKCNTRRP